MNPKATRFSRSVATSPPQLRAEEALRETEKLAAMGRVAGIIAHEINNPLAAITNIFYLLRNHPSLDDEARRSPIWPKRSCSASSTSPGRR